MQYNEVIKSNIEYIRENISKSQYEEDDDREDSYGSEVNLNSLKPFYHLLQASENVFL